jgi:hypothetical protein
VSGILTTHAGSLPRPKALVALQLRGSRGEALDPAAAPMKNRPTHG